MSPRVSCFSLAQPAYLILPVEVEPEHPDWISCLYSDTDRAGTLNSDKDQQSISITDRFPGPSLPIAMRHLLLRRLTKFFRA